MVQKSIQSQTVNSAIKYGRMWVSPSPQFAGSVVFSTCGGAHFDVTAGRSVEVPAVVAQNTPGMQQKTVRLVDQDGKDGTGRINLKSASGSVHLFITNHA